jgi:hypothetical protein
VTEKQSATFSCSASGTSVSFRWQIDGHDIVGATDSSFSLASAQNTDAGDYRCIATNSGGSASSQVAALTVQLLPPLIDSGPNSLTVIEHEAASFSCTATGTLINYQWQKDGVVIAGAQDRTFSIAHSAQSDEGAYRCVVTNSAGSVTSDPATLNVQALPPVITQQPSARTVTEHASVSFSCAASGIPVSYRWQKNGEDIAGSASATFSIDDVKYTDAGDYACVASNESGSVTSQSAALTVRLVAPVITEQPTALSVTEHAAVSFTCSASGTLVDYHWQKNGADISGATGATFSLASVAYTDAGDYRCVAQNTGGSATSQPATLSVQLLPPTVAAGPLDTRLFEHQTASFHCLGEGTLLSYQWQKDLVDVPGASAQDLTLVGVSPLDAGSYRCAIQNSGGSVFTQAATLTVDLLPPSFPTQPASVTVTEGEPFSLQCTASGTALSFQWAKDDAPLAGANTAAYTVAAAQASDAASYTCTATNSGGSVTSAPVPVVVLLKLPVITGQPSDVTVNPDEPFAFTVSAQGTQLSYQWLRAGGAIPGATSSTYSKAQASVSDDGAEYRVVVSNSAGSVPSRDAIVHISDSAGPTLSLNGATQVSVTTDTFTLSGSAVDVGSGVHDILVRNDRLPGQDFGVVIDSAGAFTGDVPLSLGTNVVTVIARDAHGNETQQTITVVVTATELPQITIIEPSNGSTVQTDSITVRGSVRSTLAASAIKLQLGNDTQFPTGAGPDYAFRFDHVRLVPGPNLISVVAQTTRGTVHGDVTVSYGAITPPPNNPVPPVITLQVGTPEVYLVTDTIPVAGSVLAQRCVQAITVNGTPTSFSGSGQTVSFSTALSFAAAGVNDLTVQVRATDCDGASSSTGFIAHRDDGAPVISIDGLQLSPAVNQLTQTPYRLSGTVTDRSLAGLTVASQSVVAVPTGGAGVWTFSIDVPLQRQLDTPIVIEAWDAAGQRSTSEVVLRLNTSLNLEVLTPRTGTQFIVSSDPVRLEVTARALGMATTDVVLARFDSEPELALARSGDSANSVLTVAPTPGAHTLSVHVQSAEGLNLAQTSISLEFIDQASIPLQVVSQEPAADSSNIEANTPITLHFNRPIEPSKLTMSVLETAHGKLFSDPPPAADMTQLSGVGLVDVNRERESVPGAAQNFPENRMVSFYPSRDYAYGGTVFVELRYDGADLWHTKFAVRPLPTLIHGFVANHTLIPLQGIEVSLPELGRSATTNDDGNWNFGFGDTPEQRIPPGRYRAIANPGRKNQRFGSIERFIEIGAGLGYAGTILIPELNNAEPFRHIASAQVTPAVLAGGDVQLDLTHATLTFPGGLPEGDVHVQFLSASQLGHVSLNGARPDWAFATQPAGVMVDGSASVSIQLPMLDQSYGYVDRLPDRMVLVGLDTRSLQIVPVGVVELDRSAHRLRSVGDMHLQRLDYLGISSVAGSAELLNSYVTHAIGLAELLAGVEAQ